MPYWFLYPPKSYFKTIGYGEGIRWNFYILFKTNFFNSDFILSALCDNLSLPFYITN